MIETKVWMKQRMYCPKKKRIGIVLDEEKKTIG
jgi:hypothetical protein